MRDEARKLRGGTDYAIVCDFTCGGPFEQAQRIRGFEQFMVDIAWDRPFAAALMERLTDNAHGLWDAMLAEVGDCVDVVCQGDDLGMQTGLQISEADYRAPRQAVPSGASSTSSTQKRRRRCGCTPAEPVSSIIRTSPRSASTP